MASSPTKLGRQKQREYWRSPQGRAAQQRRDAKRRVNAAWLATQKQGPCADCGGSFPACCMDFHHITGPKLFTVGQGISRSVAAMQAEIVKCVLVCANCHRIRHNKLTSQNS